MFVKTSHPGGDNGWCWAPGVIALMLTLTSAPGYWQWCHQMQSQASTSHRPQGVNIETWEELSQTTSWERNLIVARGFTNIQKSLLWEITLYDSWIKHFMGKVLLKAWSGSIWMNSRYPDGRWQRRELGLLELKGICWMRGGCLELSHY